MIKATIPITPLAAGRQTHSLSPSIDIDVEDMLGVWVEVSYPFATAKEPVQVGNQVQDYPLKYMKISAKLDQFFLKLKGSKDYLKTAGVCTPAHIKVY